jgi:hypothetical protein
MPDIIALEHAAEAATAAYQRARDALRAAFAAEGRLEYPSEAVAAASAAERADTATEGALWDGREQVAADAYRVASTARTEATKALQAASIAYDAALDAIRANREDPAIGAAFRAALQRYNAARDLWEEADRVAGEAFAAMQAQREAWYASRRGPSRRGQA